MGGSAGRRDAGQPPAGASGHPFPVGTALGGKETVYDRFGARRPWGAGTDPAGSQSLPGGVLLGIGYLLAFNGPPLPLAGTIWILILALSFWNLPFAYKTAAAGFRQIDRSLEEAAGNLGATSLRVLIDVYVPLLRRTAGVAFIATFVNSVTNLSITMFLVTAHYLVATVSVLALVSDNRLGVGAALTTLLLALTFGALTLGFRWIGPDILME